MNIYGDYLKFARYMGIGVITTLADWLIFYMIISYMHVFYLLALAMSYFISTILSFFLNKHFTFQNSIKSSIFNLPRS